MREIIIHFKAIKIDATAHTVTEIEIDNTLKSYYREIGCRTIEAAYPRSLPPSDVLYVDEEGLLRDNLASQPFFAIRSYPQPLVGNGLIMGVDGDGESVSPTITLEEVRKLITWRP